MLMLNMFNYAGKNNSDNENYQFWQSGNHAEIIFSDKFLQQKLNYIHHNPVRAGIVERPEDYIYSSARDYIGTKNELIEIEPVIIYE